MHEGREISGFIRVGGRWAAEAFRRVAPLTPIAGSAYAFVTDHLYMGAATAALGLSAGSWYISQKLALRGERVRSKAMHEALAGLEAAAEKFDQEVSQIYIDRQHGEDPNAREQDILKTAMFTEIAVKAKAIFDAKKPRHAPFNANVKALRRREHSQSDSKSSPYCYEILTRSQRTANTNAYDAWLRERQIPIDENPVYWGFLRPAKLGAKFEDIPPLYEMHGDLEARVNQLNADKVQYTEPNQQLVYKLMRSYFVHAIASAVPAGQADPGWYQTRGLSVPGLLCVDTHSKNAFADLDGDERDDDLALMQYLTTIAFRVFTTDVMQRIPRPPNSVASTTRQPRLRRS
jgi:hypothetical protein